MEQRAWTHDESPEALPSAAAYRLGCRCDDCRKANSEYMKAYRRRKVPMEVRAANTPKYHTHKGKPSPLTARNWGCAHDACLAMAGLFLDGDGVVRDTATKEADPLFGSEVPRAPRRKRPPATDLTGSN